MALMKIREKKYYQDMLGCKTFGEYCKKRWDFNSSRARQLIAATEIIDNIKSVTPGNAPAYEKHVRPLMCLAADQQYIGPSKMSAIADKQSSRMNPCIGSRKIR